MVVLRQVQTFQKQQCYTEFFSTVFSAKIYFVIAYITKGFLYALGLNNTDVEIYQLRALLLDSFKVIRTQNRKMSFLCYLQYLKRLMSARKWNLLMHILVQLFFTTFDVD